MRSGKGGSSSTIVCVILVFRHFVSLLPILPLFARSSQAFIVTSRILEDNRQDTPRSTSLGLIPHTFVHQTRLTIHESPFNPSTQKNELPFLNLCRSPASPRAQRSHSRSRPTERSHRLTTRTRTRIRIRFCYRRPRCFSSYYRFGCGAEPAARSTWSYDGLVTREHDTRSERRWQSTFSFRNRAEYSHWSGYHCLLCFSYR